MRTNQGEGQPTRARGGRRPLTALLAVTALVIALAGTIQPAEAHPAAPDSPAQAAGTPHTVTLRRLLVHDRRQARPTSGRASSTTSGCRARTCGSTSSRR